MHCLSPHHKCLRQLNPRMGYLAVFDGASPNSDTTSVFEQPTSLGLSNIPWVEAILSFLRYESPSSRFDGAVVVFEVLVALGMTAVDEVPIWEGLEVFDGPVYVLDTPPLPLPLPASAVLVMLDEGASHGSPFGAWNTLMEFICQYAFLKAVGLPATYSLQVLAFVPQELAFQTSSLPA